MVNKKTETDFYLNHVRHLPKVPLNAPLERGRVYHSVVAHDDWCAIYKNKECNCNPIITRHVEPRNKSK